MKRLLIERAPINGGPTMGYLTFLHQTLYTLELPWIPDPRGGRGGMERHSCVPPGTYRLIPHDRPNGDLAYALINETLDVYYLEHDIPIGISGRCLILMHIANYQKDILGCIAPGTSKGRSEFGPAVWHSETAMGRVIDYLGYDEAELTISYLSRSM